MATQAKLRRYAVWVRVDEADDHRRVAFHLYHKDAVPEEVYEQWIPAHCGGITRYSKAELVQGKAVDNPAFVAGPEARRRLEQQRGYDDIALLHVSDKDWDKLVARAAVLRQRNAMKGE
jgi:hypothetical protein